VSPAPDILVPPVREQLEGLKVVATSLRGAVEGYLASLEAALLAAYGPDTCSQMAMAHRLAKVRESLHGLIRLDDRGDVWGAVGDLEEEVLCVAAEDERRVQHVEDERRESA
jgi:hypothetical protein